MLLKKQRTDRLLWRQGLGTEREVRVVLEREGRRWQTVSSEGREGVNGSERRTET